MGFCGRADLVRILAEPEKDEFLAGLVGYYPTHTFEDPAKPAFQSSDAPPPSADSFQPQKSSIDWEPIPFFYAEQFQLDDSEIEPSTRQVKAFGARELSQCIPSEVVEMPKAPALASWPRLQRRVANLLRESVQSNELDADSLVQEFSQGRMPRSLPMRSRKRWPRQLNVIIDRSRRLTPFWQDQEKVLGHLSRYLGWHNINEYRVDDEMIDPLPMGAARKCGFNLETAKAPVPILMLGDCGALTRYQPLIGHWQRKARLFRARGCNTVALSPAPKWRWPQAWLSCWKMSTWEEPILSKKGKHDHLLADQALRLLSLISHASRVEPGLLRAIRRLLPIDQADAGTESDVWSHAYIMSGSSVALTISPDVLKELDSRYRQEDLELRNKINEILQQWHAPLPREIWYGELLHLPPEEQLVFSENIRQAAEDYYLRMAQTIMTAEKTWNSAAIQAFFQRFKRRTHFNDRLWSRRPGLSQALQEADSHVHADERIVATAAGYDPRRDGPPGSERFWSVRQYGDQLQVTERPADVQQDSAPGSTVAVLRSTRSFLHCVVETMPEGTLASVFLDPKTGKISEEYLTQPDWANTMGQDQYGLWASFRYVNVEQRLRWIPPGRFMMGSPENEVGRFDDEQQHPVTLTHGFWLFDTPVTQALWQVVMGHNPSHFKGEERPVEQVSWKNCQRFIEELNREIPGLALTLPSEAQWEYACRAGTTTPFHTGENLTTDQANYDGNYPYGDHPTGTYRQETTTVNHFAPNGWGLYDMHGNVREWCVDWWQKDLGSNAVVDPCGLKKGTFRVIRGGSWYFSAQYLRAAYRLHLAPGYHSHNLGFRCARVQVPVDGNSSLDGAGQAAEVPAGTETEFRLASGTKYVISPDNKASIVVPQSHKLQLQTDQGRWTLSSLTKPDWAEAIGRDRYGLWVNIKYNDVEQRMRWIPPGQFLMGSPENEVGRFDREQQHLVTLTRGFWLFDTPVTQALWQVVMGNNPSHFKGEERPVEQVSWEGCQRFIEKLNREIPGLALTLPSEAQWEYACRAGTTTPFHTGENLTTDQANYNGNYPYGDHPKGTYRQETTTVKHFAPNGWGLYDMHGNVYEWCADWWQSDLGSQAVVNPHGPEEGTSRVMRGGGWVDFARLVRAAYRTHFAPGLRSRNLGFRCARVQEA